MLETRQLHVEYSVMMKTLYLHARTKISFRVARVSQQSSLGSLASIIMDKIMNFNALKLKMAGIQSKQLPFRVLSLLQSVQHKKPSKKT